VVVHQFGNSTQRRVTRTLYSLWPQRTCHRSGTGRDFGGADVDPLQFGSADRRDHGVAVEPVTGAVLPAHRPDLAVVDLDPVPPRGAMLVRRDNLCLCRCHAALVARQDRFGSGHDHSRVTTSCPGSDRLSIVYVPRPHTCAAAPLTASRPTHRQYRLSGRSNRTESPGSTRGSRSLAI
jgi:hypothetical protein